MKKVIEVLRYCAIHALTLECGHIVYKRRSRPIPKALLCPYCK